MTVIFANIISLHANILNILAAVKVNFIPAGITNVPA
jgi:hypothetical protein